MTRKAVEMALGDPTALRLCLEGLLPQCRERFVNAGIGALARGEITPGEAERIAAVVGTFAGAMETANRALVSICCRF